MSSPAAARVDRVKAQMFRRAMTLPPHVVRRLAGRPVRRDGLTLSPQTQWMLRLQKLAMEPPAESKPIPQGRRILARQAVMAGGDHPVGEVHERTVRCAEGPRDARLYVPRGAGGPGPLLVFFHGGGMIYGDLDSHDALCRFLCEEAGVRVLAVDYRLAPEHPFPAGVDDAWAAYRWVAEHASDYDADPTRLAVCGDSAGGYLSAAVALRAAEEGLPLAYQLLLYPVTDMRGVSESRRTFGQRFFLTTEFMGVATDSYLQGHDPTDPRASVLFADIPSGVAPALVVTAGFDPLRDEGEEYAEKLRAAGVPVELTRYGGEIHGFANMLGFPGPSFDAMTEIAATLRSRLGAS